MPDYFDAAYFDGTYFDTQSTSTGHGSSKAPSRMQIIPQPLPEPVDPEEWISLIL